MLKNDSKEIQHVGRCHNFREIPTTLVITCSGAPYIHCLSPLRSYRHVLILFHLCLCIIKPLWPLCASVPHFDDLLVLTSIVHSVVLHLVKSETSFSLFEWHHDHLVSIHSLIAAGHGDQLGLAFCLAFIMPPCFQKRPLQNTVRLLYTPCKISAWSSIRDQVKPARGKSKQHIMAF